MYILCETTNFFFKKFEVFKIDAIGKKLKMKTKDYFISEEIAGKGLGPDDSPVDLEFKHEVWCLDCNQVIRCSVKILYCPHCGHKCDE